LPIGFRHARKGNRNLPLRMDTTYN
jgi:hypothetical protein